MSGHSVQVYIHMWLFAGQTHGSYTCRYTPCPYLSNFLRIRSQQTQTDGYLQGKQLVDICIFTNPAHIYQIYFEYGSLQRLGALYIDRWLFAGQTNHCQYLQVPTLPHFFFFKSDFDCIAKFGLKEHFHGWLLLSRSNTWLIHIQPLPVFIRFWLKIRSFCTVLTLYMDRGYLQGKHTVDTGTNPACFYQIFIEN